jgi:hypothetical protein
MNYGLYLCLLSILISKKNNYANYTWQFFFKGKFPVNLQSPRVLRINAELEAKNVRLLVTFCIGTVLLN